MTTLVFTLYQTVEKVIHVDIPDLELFKQKCQEHIDEEGSLNFWNLEDELSDYCDVLVDDETVTDENSDDFIDECEKLGIPTSSQQETDDLPF